MRSLLALMVCTGLIAWAHATKHKYFGLRANQPLVLSVTATPAEEEDLTPKQASVRQATTPGFHLTQLQQAYMNSLSAFRRDSILRSRLLAREMVTQ